MILLKFVMIFLLIIYGISAIFGLIGFLIDIIRYPQKHEKVEIISSAESAAEAYGAEQEDMKDGLILDENIKIDL